MQENVDFIKPKPYLIKIVKHIVDSITNNYRQKIQDIKTVSVHRRWIEGKCYSFFISPAEFNCEPTRKLSQYMYNMKKEVFSTLTERNTSYYTESKKFVNLDEPYRGRFEKDFPLMMSCNYTFSEVQIEGLRKEFPLLFEQPIVVLLASDGQTPKGDEAIRNSSMPVGVETIAKYELPTCFEKRQYHDMLAEMISMVYSDFHMDLMTSSCAPFVAHWRNALGRVKGTSYPPICYDGFYPDQYRGTIKW